MPAYCVGLDISETSSSSKELWMASAIHLCRVFMFTSKLPRLSGAMSWCSNERFLRSSSDTVGPPFCVSRFCGTKQHRSTGATAKTHQVQTLCTVSLVGLTYGCPFPACIDCMVSPIVPGVACAGGYYEVSRRLSQALGARMVCMIKSLNCRSRLLCASRTPDRGEAML